MKRTIDTILWPTLGFALALAWLLGGCWANAAHTNLPATLKWEVRTNWTDMGYSAKTAMWWNGQGEDPNIETHFERGTVTSNLIATVTHPDGHAAVLLKSHTIGVCERAYTWSKPQKQYGPVTFIPNSWRDSSHYVTNGIHMYFDNVTNYEHELTITNPVGGWHAYTNNSELKKLWGK